MMIVTALAVGLLAAFVHMCIFSVILGEPDNE